jgi:HlyD family secretion protein
MKRFFVWMLLVGIIVGSGAAGYNGFLAKRTGSADSPYRTAALRRGTIRQIVTSTGTVQPVRSVQVGTFVSGPILTVNVDYNDRVKANQLMARVDTRLYDATLAHEKATLAKSRADLVRVESLLNQAIRTEKRGIELKEKDAISETDYDQCVADRKSLQAQLELGKAAILECEANLLIAKTNLEFTDIRSPVDGIVIDRKVDPGQTVAASFQTPVMFVVAPDLEKKIYVYASVDEADIGLIRDAEKRRQPVTFTVDAYPGHIFRGKIAQVRYNPTTVQNVVTYTAVVEAANPELKLLPGMTANLLFQIERRENVVTVPNAALRFLPSAELVRAEDRAILESDSDDAAKASPSQQRQRYVWVVTDENQLAAVPISIGIGDKAAAELVSGDLTDGREVVIGMRSTAATK